MIFDSTKKASRLSDKKNTSSSTRYHISRKVSETALELDEWYSYLTKIDYEGSMDFPPSKPYPHAPLYDAGVRKTSPLGYERMWQTMANLVIDPKWPEDSRVEIDLNIYGAKPETQTFDEEIDWSEMSADEDQTADYLDGLIRKAHLRAMRYLRSRKIATNNSIRKHAL